MSRFEIEDIVSQDKRGIVFRAHDEELGHTVALRRFFPFGQDGGGLKEEEAVAFGIAAQRLKGTKHDAFRSVISGAVDPIDGMPFVVAEWIDGAPLETVLGGEKLDPALIIHLLRRALEVSLALSEVLGEEAVWVETEIDSIFVGSEESCRGFVFWISPFKWLGAEFGSRELSAIEELGERLAGWKGKLLADHAGHGLGGWFKWLRARPDASLAEALTALDALTSSDETTSPLKPPAAAPIPDRPVVKVKPPSAISPLMIAAAMILLLAVAGLAYYHQNAKAPSVAPQYAEQEISPPLVDPKPSPKPTTTEATPAVEQQPAPVAVTPAPTPAPPKKPAPTPATIQPDEEAIAATKVNELAAKLAREAEIKRTAAKATPRPVAAPPVRDFMPADGEKMKALKANGPASLTGVLASIRLSNAGNSLYFDFSKPADMTEIKVVIHKSGYQGEFKPETYADLIGKKLRFDGVIFREPNGRQYVKISKRDKIKVVP